MSSLGFLTESALLPSKAKKIAVDSKSILDLKAVVFQKEQERRRRRAGEDGDDKSGKYSSKKRRKTESRAQSRNRGVELRARGDEEERELDVERPDDDAALHAKSRKMLEQKAKLYEAMARGETRDSVLMKESLVDFEAKQYDVGARMMTGKDEEDDVTIIDEFGRSRRVTRRSEAFKQWQHQQKKEQDQQQEQEREQIDKTEKKTTGGGLVVSQWEHTLHSDEKTFLWQVHEQTQRSKHASKSKKQRQQERLAKLRKQAMPTSQIVPEQPRSASTPLDAAKEQHASAQAASLLNELSSLM